MRFYFYLVVLLVITQTHVNAKKQPDKLSYREPYDLTQLDFGMDVPSFMSGSIIFKAAIIDDDDYEDEFGRVNGNTEMYHFCYWLDEKISDRRTDFDEDGHYIEIDPVYNQWGIHYQQNASRYKSLATFHALNFEQFEVITDPENRLLAVGVFAHHSETTDLQKMIGYCEAHFKRATTHKKEKYRWEKDGLIYRLIIKKEEDNSFRFEFTKDEEGNLIQIDQLPADNRIYTKTYFYIYKKEIQSQLDKTLNKGLFDKL